jgi:Tfp pilus assembly protein PilX
MLTPSPRVGSNQQGIISMISVIFISILLSLLAIGLARVTADEQRSATNLLLSTRALYAAEAGVQDAVYDFRVGGSGSPGSCHTSPNLDPQISNDNTNRSSYTCVLVGGGQTLDDVVGHNRSYTINAGRISSGASLQLEWFLAGTDLPTSGYNLSLFDNSGDNPQCGTDPQTANCPSPPIMKVDVIGVPTSGFQRDDVRRHVVLLRPGTSGSTSSAAFSASSNFSDSTTEQTSLCDTGAVAGNYMCTTSFNSFSNSYSYTFVLTPLYQQRDVVNSLSGTHFRVRVTGGTANLGGLVDVTARSNDVFRRVVYNFTPNGTSLVPNYSLLSDTPFCKNPYVASTNGRVLGGTDPLTACR